MQSGIYKLVFRSGKYYIGKSEDIQTRWKQHFASFEKGTHSKRMQEEFNVSGLPTCTILLECHRDHIDLLESMIIEEHRGSLSLNGNSPKVVSQEERAALVDGMIMLKYSTAGHLEELRRLALELSAKEYECSQAGIRISMLKTQGIRIPEEVISTIQDADALIQDQDAELAQLKEELNRYKNMPIWKRIFSYI